MSGSAPRRARRPTRSRVVALLAALAGLLVSAYLTVEHYTHAATFACPESATINCVKVTTSTWSVLAGMPVALLGLIYFVAMTVLLALPAQRGALVQLRTVGAAAGVLMVVYLVYIELFQVDAICLWCTAVHALTIIVFGAVLWDTQTTAASPGASTGRAANS